MVGGLVFGNDEFKRVVVTTLLWPRANLSIAFTRMFLRQCFRNKDGKRHAYWALVASYRTVAGPRQRVVAWLGKHDEAGRLGVEQAAHDAGSPHSKESTTARGEHQLSLFSQ